MVPCLVTLIDL